MSKQRIGVFSLAYSPFVGGAEVATKEITGRLSGLDFTVFTNRFDSRWPVRETVGGADVLRLGRGSAAVGYYGRFLEKALYIWRACRAAEQEHRERPFVAVWGVMAAYAGIAALVFKLRHPEVPLLLTLQEGDSEEHILKRVGIFYPLWRLIFKKADRIQAISNYLADFARRHGATSPIDVVPNGVEPSQFTSPPQRSAQNPTIITTSRLISKNGIDILIRAAAELKKKIPGLRLRILGTGPEEEKLKKLAKELDVEWATEFLGHVPPGEVPAHLARADVFARPSRSEGLGSSFLEAMAAGLPVIGTPVGGIPDFLKDGETGLFAKVDDPSDLAAKLEMILRHAESRDAISRNGQKLVRENYRWENIAERMAGIFSGLTVRRRTPAARILVATGIYPPDIGGPATYSALLKEELPKRGLEVGIVTYGPAGVSRKLPKGLRHLAYFWRVLRESKGADIIFAQDTVSAGLPAMLAARIAGKNFFIRVAGDHAWEQAVQRFGVKSGIDEFQKKKYGWRVELLRAVQKFVVNQADLVITPSKYFRRLVSGWVKHPNAVRVIYNGIKLREAIPPKNGGREKLILSAGRLVPWKGFAALIEAMTELPDWRLAIAGEGPERENLEKKIGELNLSERVRLVGALPSGELRRYLGRAAVFVLNTSFESFSFQVVEAMNAGVPVITTRIGNLEEIITDGEEGVLVEPDNTGQIIAAVHRIEGDAGLRKKIIENAKRKAQQFSIENTLNNLEKLVRPSQNALMISTDREIFRPGSPVRKRIEEYGALLDELHVVVFSLAKEKLADIKLAENIFVYPANSLGPFGYTHDSYRIAVKVAHGRPLAAITTQDPFETGLVGSWLKEEYDIPLQVQVHTDFLSPYFAAESLKNRVRVRMAKRILPKADGIRVVSERIKDSLLRFRPRLAEKITVLPIFVDVEAIKTAEPAFDLRKKYGGYDFIVLMVSRLTREKNIILAIEAMTEVVKENPGALLLVVGSGPESGWLHFLAKKAGLGKSVAFEAATHDLVSYYKGADLFLLTSNYEGYGRTIIEATAAGLPIVMTDVGVAIGKVVPVGDKGAVAEAVLELMSDESKRKNLAEEQTSVLKGLRSRKDYLRLYAESLRMKAGPSLLFITQKVDADDDVLGVYHRWIEELAKNFKKINVICLYRGRAALPANVWVHSLGKETGASRWKYLVNFYKYAWQLRNDYDVVFVHMNPEYVVLAGWFWKLLGKKIVLWYAHYLATWRLRAAACFADKIVTSTRLAYPLPSKKLEVLQQGIDTGMFKPAGVHDAGKAVKMLYLGRIAPVKNLDVLLRALQLVAKRQPVISLTIVGGPTPGKPVETNYYEKIKNLVKELGLESRVAFRPPVPNRETPVIYNEHDLFVNLTDTGSFDKSTLEAMACGLTVIVSNRAFLEIFPAPLAERLMFAEKDYNDLAEKIGRFLETPPAERQKIGVKMRELVIERHDLRKLAERLAAVIKN